MTTASTNSTNESSQHSDSDSTHPPAYDDKPPNYADIVKLPTFEEVELMHSILGANDLCADDEIQGQGFALFSFLRRCANHSIRMFKSLGKSVHSNKRLPVSKPSN